MFNIFKKQKENIQEPLGFEPEERATPWLGRILLLILTGVLLFFGWVGLGDLGNIPQKPENLSLCAGPYSYQTGRITKSEHQTGRITKAPRDPYPQDFGYYGEYYFQERNQPCVFSSFEIQTGVPGAYETARETWREKDALSKNTIAPLEKQFEILEGSLQKKQDEYNTSLREKIAGEPGVAKTPDQLRPELQQLERQRDGLKQTLATHRDRLASLESRLKGEVGALQSKLEDAADLYNHSWARYKLKVFFLELFFTIPSFFFAAWIYFRMLRKDSPHTIIFLPVVTVAGILLARTLLVYFWAWFLADLLEFILRLAGVFQIFRVMLFYLGMIIAIIIFGGSVYVLQKRIYSSERVRARRIRARKCPYCDSPYEFTGNYCAGCGKQILAACPSCGKAKYLDLKYCPSCGKS